MKGWAGKAGSRMGGWFLCTTPYSAVPFVSFGIGGNAQCCEPEPNVSSTGHLCPQLHCSLSSWQPPSLPGRDGSFIAQKPLLPRGSTAELPKKSRMLLKKKEKKDKKSSKDKGKRRSTVRRASNMPPGVRANANQSHSLRSASPASRRPSSQPKSHAASTLLTTSEDGLKIEEDDIITPQSLPFLEAMTQGASRVVARGLIGFLMCRHEECGAEMEVEQQARRAAMSTARKIHQLIKTGSGTPHLFWLRKGVFIKMGANDDPL